MSVFRQLRAFIRKEKLDAEMSEEMRAHLELQAAENEQRGMSPEEARFAAMREFGGVEQIKERARDGRARGFRWLEQLAQDVRYGARQMRRNPGFTAFAALSLGLGIGVNVIVFSLVNAAVFRPLPGVGGPEQLVYVNPFGRGGISYPEYEFCRDNNTVFSGFAASVECLNAPTIRDPSAPNSAVAAEERVGSVRLVSANYFSVMQAGLAFGRGFSSEEDRASGGRPAMILNYDYWRARFNADPKIVGRTLLLNGVEFTVVGVARETAPLEPGMVRIPWAWVPLAMSPVLEPAIDRLHAHQDGRARVYFFGRLKAGATFAQARAEMLGLDANYAREFLPPNPRRIPWATFLSHGYAMLPWDNPDIVASVVGIFALTSVVLLVACANVACLLLARATTRQREIGVRLAMGASRGRVVRQLLTESAMIAGLGGMVALVVGMWCGEIFWPWLFGLDLPPALRQFFGLDWHMTLWTAVVAFGTGVTFGLVPALESVNASVQSALKQEGGAFGTRLSRSRLRGHLVTVQIAVSATFLIAATLALRMVWQKMTVAVTFDPGQVCLFENSTPPGAQAAQHPREFQSALLERIRALPGVTAASVGDVWYGRDLNPHDVLVDGQSAANAVGANESRVEPDFFHTIGVGVVRGRLFTADEARSHAPVFVVSTTFAEHFWPRQDALGHRLRLRRDDPEGIVIGVVQDGARTIRNRYAFKPMVGDLYSPLWPDANGLYEVWVRVAAAPAPIERAVMAETRRLDPNAQLNPRGTLRDLYEQWRSRTVTVCAIVATLGGLALLLAAMGVYGVMAYAVAQRTREIGVRLALGASGRAITRLVLGDGLRLVAWGLVLGAGGCAAAAWVLRALLYGVSPLDPVAFGGISALLVTMALAACWLPARRAAKVDPIEALRAE